MIRGIILPWGNPIKGFPSDGKSAPPSGAAITHFYVEQGEKFISQQAPSGAANYTVACKIQKRHNRSRQP